MRIRVVISVLAFLLVVGAGERAVAQIKIIPKAKLDSVANPRTVAGEWLEIVGGESLSFGTIDEDCGKWCGSVSLKNVGTKPLVITTLRSTCSCLQVVAPKGAIGVGKSVEVSLTYYPKGHPGSVEQRVYVYTNLSTTTPTKVLRLRGVVTPSKNKAGDYPFSRGELRMRQDTVSLQEGGVVRVACLNSGTRALRLECDTLLSAKGLRLRTEPAVLKGGEEGDLVISATGAEAGQMLKLYIKGLVLPPRQRFITIKIEE